MVRALREFSLSYEETAKLMKEVSKDTKSLRPLWGKAGRRNTESSQLINLGVALIAFPIPTIGIKKSLGAILIAAGLVQEKRRHIHVADVYATEGDLEGEGDGKRRQVLFIGCGCLALTLACLAVALFLWYAPAAFWNFLIDLGIPIPGNPF